MLVGVAVRLGEILQRLGVVPYADEFAFALDEAATQYEKSGDLGAYVQHIEATQSDLPETEHARALRHLLGEHLVHVNPDMASVA